MQICFRFPSKLWYHGSRMEEAGGSGDVIVRAEKQKSAVNLREKFISVSRRCLHMTSGMRQQQIARQFWWTQAVLWIFCDNTRITRDGVYQIGFPPTHTKSSSKYLSSDCYLRFFTLFRRFSIIEIPRHYFASDFGSQKRPKPMSNRFDWKSSVFHIHKRDEPTDKKFA